MHTALLPGIHEGRSPATRIALLSNIHANLQALEAVVADARRRGATRFVCLGNVVGNGPNPIETLRWVKENCDWLLVGLFEDGFLERSNPEYWSAIMFAESVVWARQEFQKHPETADLVAWLAQCPKAVLAPPLWFILGPPGSDGIGWHIITPRVLRVAPDEARKWFASFPRRSRHASPARCIGPGSSGRTAGPHPSPL